MISSLGHPRLAPWAAFFRRFAAAAGRVFRFPDASELYTGSLRDVSWAAQDFAGEGARHLSLIDHGDAVHQDVFHSFGKLIGIVEGGAVADGGGIEDDHVGPHAGFEHSAIGEAHALRGQRGEFADRIFEGQNFFFADIFGQDARERSVGARVGMRLAENSFGRGAFGIVVDGDPGLLQGERDIGLRHAEDGDFAGGIFDEKVEERVHGIFVPQLRDF